MAKIDKLLTAMMKYKGNQLIFRSGEAPVIMVEGDCKEPTQTKLRGEQILALMLEIADEDSQELLKKRKSATFSYALTDCGNFDVEVDIDRNSILAIIHPELKEEKTDHPSAQDSPGEESKAAPKGDKAELRTVLEEMVTQQASDLLLAARERPFLRINGKIVVSERFLPVQPSTLHKMINRLLSDENQREFEEKKNTHTGIDYPGAGRFRLAVYTDQYGMVAAFRRLPDHIPSFEELGLPPIVNKLCSLDQGLIIVSGLLGSGRTSTLAAMIDNINSHLSRHIITIEDPIELMHESDQSLINQLQVGNHTPSFETAIEASSYQSPDVLMVADLQNPRVLEQALQMAEAGCLVLGAMTTADSVSTINRILGVFDAQTRPRIRCLLENTLRGIISQALLNQTDGKEISAREIMTINTAIIEAIRTEKTSQVPSIIQANSAQGMVLFKDSLLNLIQEKKVLPMEALRVAPDKEGFMNLMTEKGIKINPKPKADSG
jgi:twitching motility protein PilT